jgi:hypothetical protein
VIKMNKPTKLYSIYDQPAGNDKAKDAPAGSVPDVTNPKQMPPDHAAPPPTGEGKPTPAPQSPPK